MHSKAAGPPAADTLTAVSSPATTPTLDPARPLPRAVWLLSWASFFADVSGEMIYPLLPLFLIGAGFALVALLALGVFRIVHVRQTAH